MTTQNIKALLFDLDGTLVDLCEIHRRSFREALHEVCDKRRVKAPSYEDAELEALPTKRKVEILSERAPWLTPLAEEINTRKQELTLAEHNTSLVGPGPGLGGGLPHLLRRCKENGLKIGVVSNSVRATVETYLKRAGLFEYVDTIVSNEDVEQPKPSADGYLKACGALGVLPQESLAFEDSLVGLLAATFAGCWPVQTAFVPSPIGPSPGLLYTLPTILRGAGIYV